MTSVAPEPGPPADVPGPSTSRASAVGHSGHSGGGSMGHGGHGQPGTGAAAGPATHSGRHSWMMIACCVPMLAIGIVLVATGVVGVGFLLVALGCTAVMALMMRGMSHGGRS